MSLAIEAFVENARSFCAWVESDTHDPLRARQLILSLMAGVPYLIAKEEGKDSDQEYPHREHEDRKVTHAKLADFPIQFYRDTFDPLDFANTEIGTGDVHDDLADIYGDLWHGLHALDRGDGVYAINYWRSFYMYHWGQHAASALRAIDEHYRTR